MLVYQRVPKGIRLDVSRPRIWCIELSYLSHRTTDCNKFQSIINDHQLSSTIINYHELSSTTINCHQLSSTIINYHQLSSTIIDYHQLSSTIINYYQLSSTIIDYNRLSSTILEWQNYAKLGSEASRGPRFRTSIHLDANSIYKKMASSRFLRHQRPSGTPVAVMWKDMTHCLLLDVTYREMAIWSEMTMNQNHVLLRFFRNGHWNHLKSSPNPQQSQLQTKLSPSVRGTFGTASAASSLRAHRGSPHPITTDGFASAARAALCGAGCLSKNAWCILSM
jgi:hypothetical protein